jgi:hypothetical protein
VYLRRYTLTHLSLLIVYAAIVFACAGCKDSAPPPDTSQPPPTEPLVTYTEERTPCADRTVERRAYFGDLHVHTGFSFDARSYQNVLTPADAYSFAQGNAVTLAPLDEQGKGMRVAQLDRPLDFVSVTDHAEFLGEIYHCTTPGSAGYDSDACTDYRNPETNGAFQFGTLLSLKNPSRFEDICGEDGLGCQAAAKGQWEAMQSAAEAAYDRTDSCTFTAFVGYEYTNTLAVSNLHRNVVFRNATVPEYPVTYFDAGTPLSLWQMLDQKCIQAGTGCDVVVLPHNSNLSNGKLFEPTYEGAETVPEEAAVATLRARMEPVAEIFQHKGDSECRSDFSTIGGEVDSLCDFEKLRSSPVDECSNFLGTGGMRLWGCSHPLDFLRNVLKEGLKEHQRIGVNPYRLGFIGSTDTHNGTPGHVSDIDFPGHVGLVDDTPQKRLGSGTVTHNGIINNPGGLAAVWAVENSRDAIFEAITRRETFATSGPRIRLRLFGGWAYPASLCDEPDTLVAQADEGGVPMGGILGERPAETTAPVFVIRAQHDPGTDERPGTALQRIQVVKGWVDDAGNAHEKVYEVGGNPDNGAGVDLTTCETQGTGSDTLCTVWTDPDFDSTARAFYYARAIENPTCRWSTRTCLPLIGSARPESCDDSSVPKTVQERAWSSPIWYTPPPSR